MTSYDARWELTLRVPWVIALVFLVGSEVFAQGSFRPTGNLVNARYDHTATLLANGKVLVAGGYVGTGGGDQTALAELYDPVTRTWSSTGSMTARRYGHTATLLPNGKVLVSGGHASGTTFSSAELYDPDGGTWSPTGSMYSKRFLHTATLLTSGPNAGKVLVVGGGLSEVSGVPGLMATTELCDPSSESWSPSGSLAAPRSLHNATRLADGSVLVAGGNVADVGGQVVAAASAELYDSIGGTWSATGSMATPRPQATLTLLPDGNVLAAGGCSPPCGSFATGLSSAEVYDPLSGVWITVGNMTGRRYAHTATLLWTGHVLVAGGLTSVAVHMSAELFDPVTSTWFAGGSMSIPRRLHTATALASGQVLVAGGLQDSGGNVFTSSAELFNVVLVTPVNIDIKPGSFPNSINLGSGGTVAVAILSTATFDATMVDPTTVSLASAPVQLRGKGTPMASTQDVNGDGLQDFVVHVTTEALQLTDTDTEAVLEGETFAGEAIRGQDSVRVVQ